MTATLTKSRPQVQPNATSRNPLMLLRQEMDDMIARFWDGEQERSWFAGTFAPSADLVEEDNAFEIRMDIPGMEAKDIEVQAYRNVVTVSGQRKDEKEEKGKTYHRVERRTGNFARTITLPCNVNEDEIAAEYNNGVLMLKLPKCEEARSKKVTVKG